MNLKQKERNEIAIKIFKLLNKERPKPDIFDCIDILNNLQEGYVKELEFNTLIKDETKYWIFNKEVTKEEWEINNWSNSFNKLVEEQTE